MKTYVKKIYFLVFITNLIQLEAACVTHVRKAPMRHTSFTKQEHARLQQPPTSPNEALIVSPQNTSPTGIHTQPPLNTSTFTTAFAPQRAPLQQTALACSTITQQALYACTRANSSATTLRLQPPMRRASSPAILFQPTPPVHPVQDKYFIEKISHRETDATGMRFIRLRFNPSQFATYTQDFLHSSTLEKINALERTLFTSYIYHDHLLIALEMVHLRFRIASLSRERHREFALSLIFSIYNTFDMIARNTSAQTYRSTVDVAEEMWLSHFAKPDTQVEYHAWQRFIDALKNCFIEYPPQ